MTFAQLGESEDDVQRSASVAFVDSVPDGAVLVRRGLIEAETFTSRHTEVFERSVAKQVVERYNFSRDNPLLSEGEMAHLDEDGLIVEGRRVEAGDVLWSCTYTDKPNLPAKDESERVPHGWDGATVTEAAWSEDKKGMSVRVCLEIHRELIPGDLLCVGVHNLGVVSEVLDDDEAVTFASGAEIVASRGAAERLDCTGQVASLDVAKHIDVAAYHVQSRRDGPYSLISQQPLRRSPFAPPQSITVHHIRWLMERGLVHTAQELVGLKSDEVDSREALEQFGRGQIGRDELPPPSGPVSRWLFIAELMAMGFHVELNDDRELRLRPMTHDEVLETSNGRVIKPETLNYRTYDGEPDGLFCPTIFADDRSQFGHLELPSPIVPIWWRLGSPSLLERLLPLSAEQIDALTFGNDCARIEDGEAVLAGGPLAQQDQDWFEGGTAIRMLLKEFASDDLPGLVSGVEALVPEVLLVLPAPIRPIVLLDSGNFATSDLNDLYRRLINRCNRLKKLVELKAPAVIVSNERRMLQQCADSLYANQLTARPVLGVGNQPLKSLSDLCLSHTVSTTGKRAVWSAQARAVVDLDLAENTIVVPQGIFDHLRLEERLPILLTREDRAAFAALAPRPGDGLLFRIPQSAADEVELPDDGDAFLSLHVPLRADAVAESKQLMRGDVSVKQLPQASSWLEQSDPDETLTQLIEAAIQHTSVRLDTPRLVLQHG